mmetsp:Transcript_4231/g.9088  ORF Transcript_4231/g.9088 Transcript_4231/m.9088 type:complete len:196 (+) Transcript_4231:168-755(+)
MKGIAPSMRAMALLQLCILFHMGSKPHFGASAFTNHPSQRNAILIRSTSIRPFKNSKNLEPLAKRARGTISPTKLHVTISEKEANSAIDKVVQVLRKDKLANEELGRLQKVNNILGYGSPRQGVLAVRFNASFQKRGMGRSAVPLPFGLGQSNKAEGRGTMVGQVKASVDAKTGKILEASVFRDLGYGRAFNLKV